MALVIAQHWDTPLSIFSLIIYIYIGSRSGGGTSAFVYYA